MIRCKKPCAFNDCGRPCMEPKRHSTRLRAHACCAAHAAFGSKAPSGIAPFELTSAHLNLANSKQAVKLLRERTVVDPPPAPPAPGVEPATVFAARLARKLCYGHPLRPLRSFITEILQAVRVRDEAIVVAVSRRR